MVGLQALNLELDVPRAKLLQKPAKERHGLNGAASNSSLPVLVSSPVLGCLVRVSALTFFVSSRYDRYCTLDWVNESVRETEGEINVRRHGSPIDMDD